MDTINQLSNSRERASAQLRLLKERSSPVSFEDTPVNKDQLMELFEAARWAASCFNEQPWRFIVAQKENKSLYGKVLNGINSHNQKWAQKAPVLMLTFAKKTFSRNGVENKHSWHDVGLAIGNLSAQATAMGLHLHQMAGIVRENIYEDFSIPEDYEVVSAIALGYRTSIDSVPEEFKDRELKERTRKEIDEIAFNEEWGKSSLLKS